MPLFTSEYVFSDDYPTIEPSLKLDFANARALDPRITFTRASTATYVGANGLIKTAGVDEARFDHDPSTGESLGLLIEESRTNLIPHSQELNAATWNKYFGSSVSANYAIAPDGTQTADRIIFNGTTYGQVVHNLSGLTIGQQYVFSAWVKSDGTSNNSCTLYMSGNGIQIIPTNEWQRIYFVRTAAGTGENPLFLCGSVNSLLVWGVQFELGAFPTSYIPTSGSTATRSKDDALITGGSFESWINKNEGTWLIDFRTLGSGSGLLSISATGGSVNERYMMLNIATDGIVSAAVVDGGVLQTNESIFFTPTQTAQFTKAIFAVKDNDFAITANGLTPVTDTSGTVYNSPTQLRFAYGNVSSTPYAHFKTCIYYPKRLTNAQLQTLTQ